MINLTKKYITLLFFLFSVVFPSDLNDKINKSFIQSGSIESLIQSDVEYNELILIQLDILDKDLLEIINTNIPDIDLNVGLGSYHRIFPKVQFNILEELAPDSSFKIIKRPYYLQENTRDFWIHLKQGSETHGTYTQDDAVSYTCDCIDGASDCVKLGWDSWYNPFDYWAEAWWAFSPPDHTSINEIRVRVRGAQCDDLPLWSDTYMGMRDENGTFSQDYLLSEEYTDNLYVVPEIWSEGMLMPMIGSNDNYVIDEVTLQFFYTCSSPDSPISLISSNADYCDYVSISWEAPNENEDVLGYNLYRDGDLVTIFGPDIFSFFDYNAIENITHEYCISSFGECGESEFLCMEGSLKNNADEALNIEASDGLYQDVVIVTWEASENAEEYKIYRDNSWISLVSQNSNLEFIDQFIESQVDYNYCIESINNCGSSSLVCDIGFSSLLLGDINEDNSLDVLDVVLVVNFVMGYDPLTDSQQLLSDMNSDSLINVQDIVLLANLILE